MNDKSAGYRTSVSAAIFTVSEHCSYNRSQASTRGLDQQVAQAEDVLDVSSCSCAIYMRRSKKQDLSTSGEKKVQPRNILVWLNW